VLKIDLRMMLVVGDSSIYHSAAGAVM